MDTAEIEAFETDNPGCRTVLEVVSNFHPSFPWQEEALAVATHKPQVYIDLSGWSSKYFPPILVQHANTLLKDKVLFGTDFPMLTPERWRGDLEQTAIRDQIKPALYKHNAARLLGL
jgi:uncharacterized protein